MTRSIDTSHPEAGDDLAAFLRDRRGRVDPRQVGLPSGSRRRVAGLRREEVAQLADLSVDYYARLEQGRQRTASPSVLRSVAKALRLNSDEQVHLFALAGVPVAAAPRVEPGADPDGRVRALLSTFGDNPALVITRFTDIVYANPGATFLFEDFGALPSAERNATAWMLLAPQARELYGDRWECCAKQLIGLLRLDAGRHPGDPRLAELTAELSERSELFRRQWQRQFVTALHHFKRRMRHPGFGEMVIANEFLTAHVAPDLSIILMVPDEPERFAAALRRRLH